VAPGAPLLNRKTTCAPEVKHDGHIRCADARTQPATSGLLGARMHARGVRSLLSSGFCVEGQLVGVFTCSQVGKRVQWSPRQPGMPSQIAARAGATLVKAIPPGARP
jgi:hypothetical protein